MIKDNIGSLLRNSENILFEIRRFNNIFSANNNKPSNSLFTMIPKIVEILPTFAVIFPLFLKIVKQLVTNKTQPAYDSFNNFNSSEFVCEKTNPVTGSNLTELFKNIEVLAHTPSILNLKNSLFPLKETTDPLYMFSPPNQQKTTGTFSSELSAKSSDSEDSVNSVEFELSKSKKYTKPMKTESKFSNRQRRLKHFQKISPKQVKKIDFNFRIEKPSSPENDMSSVSNNSEYVSNNSEYVIANSEYVSNNNEYVNNVDDQSKDL